MKQHFALVRSATAIALPLTLLAWAPPVQAQGTAFGFQGRLNTNGAAATGLYDFQFALYGAAENGTPLTSSISTNALGVTNGLFSVALDFGAGMFPGAQRWLEIQVRTNGNGPFTALAPRQPLLPTPYSLFAESAGSFPPGSVVKSLNSLHDDITLEAGPNVT
ncbi:MAG TPA: hypothetical protein VHI52_01280, partial [Verrucomicrobiae bacterium]|nr:hypothetical protein [Verrucomicrobiae bacterium]